MSETPVKHWKVGELASATGVSVRALHHYHDLGLLVPSERTHAGYRLYDEADLRRLYRIVSLRGLGLSLEQIADVLDDAVGLAPTVRQQLDAVKRQLLALNQLRDRLAGVADALDRGGEPSIDQLIATMEAMAMHEKYVSPEQLDQLKRRGEELGQEQVRAAELEWADIFAALREEMEAGTNPTDRRLKVYRDRSRELLQAFTGGDPGITESMRRMWDNEDPEQISRGVVDRELFGYAKQVFTS